MVCTRSSYDAEITDRDTALPFYITGMGGTGIHYGQLIAVYGIMQLVFAPVWGTLSDSIGRKPILLIGTAGLSRAMVLFALSQELWILYGAQVFSGALSSAMLPTSQAYISDSTNKNDRAGVLDRIGGSVGMGMILGPGIGGLLVSESLSLPFLVASGFCLITFLLILAFLPESLKKQHRQTEDKLKLMHLQSLGRMLLLPMGFCLIAVFFAILGQTIFSSVYGLYALHRFGYGPGQVGTILTAMAFMYALSLGVLAGPVNKRFREHQIIPAALSGTAL